MQRDVQVCGVAMTPFKKPGESDGYELMAEQAGREALRDAGIDYQDVEQVYVGYVYGESTCGQRAVYGLGLSGVPIINVNNNCSTGSTALFLARQAIESGAAECVLALGFEQMERGALGSKYTDREAPIGPHVRMMSDVQGFTAAPPAAQMFGGAGREYRFEHGTKRETFAQISVKARAHAAKNPNAVFRETLSIEEVLAAPEIFDPLTRYQCCPPTCGAAAAILCSKNYAQKHGLSQQVRIIAQDMRTDQPDYVADGSMIKMVGYGMTEAASQACFEAAGISPSDIDVVELHDCFTANELLTYEGLGLCAQGEAERFIVDGDNTYGGQVVTNPSGGLLSKGHPLGATGLAQCYELVHQLRGSADARQVEGARLALQHNLGLGGACVVTLYEKAASGA
ncbi:MAG: lipid-transfer protein [Pseudomonadota bacterium]